MRAQTFIWSFIIGFVFTTTTPAADAGSESGAIAILSAKWDKEPRKASAFVIHLEDRSALLVTRAAILNGGRHVGGTQPELSIYFHPGSTLEVGCKAHVDSFFHELDLGVARIDDHIEQPLAELSIPEPVDISKNAPPRSGEPLTLHTFHERSGKFRFARSQVTPSDPLLDLHGEAAVWPIDEALSDLALGAPVFHPDGKFAGVVTHLGDKIVIVPAIRIVEMAESGFTRTVEHRATSSRYLKGRLKVRWEESSLDPFSRLQKANYIFLAADKLPESARLADGSWDLEGVDGAFRGDLHRHDFKAEPTGEMTLWAQRVETLRGHRTRKLPPLRAVFQLSAEPMHGTISTPGVPVSESPARSTILASRGPISPSKSYPAPAKIVSAVLGGSGNYLFALLDGKRVAVFDALQAKWIADAPLPLAGEKFFVAANHNYAFVANGAGEVIRLEFPSLRTVGETIVTGADKITAIAAGNASAYSPLLIQAREKAVSIDPNKWTMRAPQTFRGAMPLGTSGHLSASPDGQLFCAVNSHDQASLVRWEGDDRFTLQSAKPQPAPCWPDPAGRHLYSRRITTVPSVDRNEVFDVVQNIPNEGFWRPGESGAFFLSLPFRRIGTNQGERTPLVTVFSALDQSEVATLGWFQEMAIGPDQTMHRNSERIWLATRQGLIITLPFSNDRACLRPFDPKELAKQRGDQFVATTAGENHVVEAGTQWSLEPFIYSSPTPKTKPHLLHGPEGMTLDDGKLTWSVPDRHSDAKISAILIQKGSGNTDQPILLTFEIVNPNN